MARWMNRGMMWVAGTTLLGLGAAAMHGAQPPEWKSGVAWPQPKSVQPGTENSAPSDAIVLFDGKDLSQWKGAEKWEIKDGYAICGGELVTRRAFGDCQLHIEWASPEKVQGSSQARGNSGVFLMGLYELQILDSYENETYFDGQAGSLYKQRPPLVNVCRKPGEWQSYDVVFHAPHFAPEGGKLLKPAYITVLQNGVLVLDHFEILGRTEYRKPPMYLPHPDKLPIHIQYHHSPVRFRNIWIRDLPDDNSAMLAPLRQRLQSATTKPKG